MTVHSSVPVALVTGASRRAGLAAAIAEGLAIDGWDIALTYWTPYDRGMPWGTDVGGPAAIAASIEAAGRSCFSLEADLSHPATPERLFEASQQALGPVSALVIAHCDATAGGIQDTTLESFDLHFAVNARATWLLIRELSRQLPQGSQRGRIVTLTSDHLIGNLPYGSSKAAADRITLAAAHDLAPQMVTANVINPGPVDTGWMTPDMQERVKEETPLPRTSTPADVADLVRFLFSQAGGWVTAQLLHSNGGLRSTIP